MAVDEVRLMVVEVVAATVKRFLESVLLRVTSEREWFSFWANLP